MPEIPGILKSELFWSAFSALIAFAVLVGTIGGAVIALLRSHRAGRLQATLGHEHKFYEEQARRVAAEPVKFSKGHWGHPLKGLSREKNTSPSGPHTQNPVATWALTLVQAASTRSHPSFSLVGLRSARADSHQSPIWIKAAAFSKVDRNAALGRLSGPRN